MTTSLVNGQLSSHIDLSDRGFSYGDGVFETILVVDGKALLLKRHTARLERGLDRLSIVVKQSFKDDLLGEIYDLASSQQYAFLKLVVTRGGGGRGYRASAELQPSRVIMVSPAPTPATEVYQQGCSLFACQTRLGLNPQLAGIKHMNRLEQVLARNEWQDQYTEGLVCDLNGNLIEGTMSNLFLICGQQLLTPKLDQCGVEGVVRSVIIDAARQQGVELLEQRLSPEDLLGADGAFISNTGFGVLAVGTFAGQPISSSPMTQHASQWLAEARRCES